MVYLNYFFKLFRNIHSSTSYSFLGRLYSIFAGVVTTILIIIYFDKYSQGVFYTQLSLINIIIVFESTITSTFLHLISYDGSRLKIVNNEIVGNLKQLQLVNNFLNYFNSRVFLIFIFVSIFIFLYGYYIFSEDKFFIKNYFIFWLFLSMIVSCRIFFFPILALLECLGNVTEVYKLKLIQYILSTFILFIFIIKEFSFLALLFSQLSIIIFFSIYFFYYYRKLIRNYFLFLFPSKKIISQDNLIFLFKTFLQSMFSFLYFFIYVPIVFYNMGSNSAGALGLTLTIILSIHALSLSYISPKIRSIGNLLSLKEFYKLNKLVLKIIYIPGLIYLFISFFVLVFIFFINKYELSFADRLLDLKITSIFLLNFFLQLLFYPLILYVRAHKVEVFLKITILTSILCILFVYISSTYNSILFISLSTLFVTLLTLPYIIYQYRKFKSLNNNDSFKNTITN